MFCLQDCLLVVSSFKGMQRDADLSRFATSCSWRFRRRALAELSSFSQMHSPVRFPAHQGLYTVSVRSAPTRKLLGYLNGAVVPYGRSQCPSQVVEESQAYSVPYYSRCLSSIALHPLSGSRFAELRSMIKERCRTPAEHCCKG